MAYYMIIRAYSCSAAGENFCIEDYSRIIRFSGTISLPYLFNTLIRF